MSHLDILTNLHKLHDQGIFYPGLQGDDHGGGADGGDGDWWWPGSKAGGGPTLCQSSLTKSGLKVCGRGRKMRNVARDSLRQLDITNCTVSKFEGRGAV